MSVPIDWAALLQSALSPPPNGLGLHPEAFWRLTPMEFRLMLGQGQAVPPLSRARLAELVAAFPDKQETQDGGDRHV